MARARLGSLVGGFLLAAGGASAQPTASPPPIADNSFLIEEAYNQEAGVIQHISAFTRFGAGEWSYSFTEEWPAPRQRHQLSLTLPFAAVDGESGVGDALVNYRFQALDGSRGVAFAPRLSLVVPSGSSSRGLGAGGAGVQGNLPMSMELGPAFVAHSNLGATWVPSGRNAQEHEAAVWAYNAGQSLIWRVRPAFNVMVELAWTRAQAVVAPEVTAHRDALYLSPGIRWAHNFTSGLQIVPGLAVPLGLGPSRGDTGVLVYLSFEHPLW